MLVTWTTKLQPLGSVIHTLTSSTTRQTLRLRWIAWSSVSAKSSASTPATVCCAHPASSNSLFRDHCATSCFPHSKISTLCIIICSQVDNVFKLACENVAKTDTGGAKRIKSLLIEHVKNNFYVLTVIFTQHAVHTFMVNRLKSKHSWLNVIILTCWHRRTTHTLPSSKNVVASWWTINTFNLTSIKSRVIHGKIINF